MQTDGLQWEICLGKEDNYGSKICFGWNGDGTFGDIVCTHEWCGQYVGADTGSEG